MNHILTYTTAGMSQLFRLDFLLHFKNLKRQCALTRFNYLSLRNNIMMKFDKTLNEKKNKLLCIVDGYLNLIFVRISITKFKHHVSLYVDVPLTQ